MLLSVIPVTHAPASEARKSAAPQMSLGAPMRRSSVPAATFSSPAQPTVRWLSPQIGGRLGCQATARSMHGTAEAGTRTAYVQ